MAIKISLSNVIPTQSELKIKVAFGSLLNQNTTPTLGALYIYMYIYIPVEYKKADHTWFHFMPMNPETNRPNVRCCSPCVDSWID